MSISLHLLIASDTAMSEISIVNKNEHDIAAISDHLDQHIGRRKRMIGFGRVTREDHD
jgi:hypothetical protein